MSAFLWAQLALNPQTRIEVDSYGAVVVGSPGNDLRISGTPDDLARLAEVLDNAATALDRLDPMPARSWHGEPS